MQEEIKEKAKILCDDTQSLAETGMKPMEIVKYLSDRRDNLYKKYGDEFTLALLDELESRCETLRNLGFIE